MFILFKQNDTTLQYSRRAQISGGIDFPEFKHFVMRLEQEARFFFINIWDDSYYGRYWTNYDSIHVPGRYFKHK